MERPARAPAQLSESLHKRLSAYALAASASGVGVLAVAQPTEARIVYAPAHHTITLEHHHYRLDLNHDGIVDFSFSLGSHCCAAVGLRVVAWSSAKVRGIGRIVGKADQGWSTGGSAFPLRGGVRVDHANLKYGFMAGVTYYSGSPGPCFGLWAGEGNGVQDRYVGLRFSISGKYHYGWAKLSISCGEPQSSLGMNGTLTG